MKPGGVVSLKRINSFNFFGKNRLIILMCCAFVVGVIVGTIPFFRETGTTEISHKLFEFYINQRQGLTYFNVFFSALIESFIVAIAFFTLGASVTGVVVSPLMCCCIGIYFGCISSYAYSAFALKGVAFNAIILIPSALGFCICSFFAAKDSFCFSAVILKLLLPKSRPSNLSSEFRSYCGKYIIIVGFYIVVSLIDAAVSTLFLKFFEF